MSAQGVPAQTPPPTPPSQETNLDDGVRTTLAIAIGIGGLVVIIGAWALRSATDAESISSIMTGLMGTVLGYYYGASGKAASDKAAINANQKADSAQKDATSRVDAAQKDAASKVDTAHKAVHTALARVSAARARLTSAAIPAGPGGKLMKAAGAATPEEATAAAISDLDEVVSTLSQM